MDTGVLIALCATAAVIGATGTWSPCGFSMIETIGPTGHTGGRRTTLAACATFLPGALVGGVATLGLLGALGAALLGAAGEVAYGVAAALALVAAVLEARGTPILPQVRRQLPEHWRRVLPMPLAAALYGVLLGLGFTTFVLSYGVWALMGIAVAVGDAEAGALAGLAFGLGRALPIVSLAPFAGTPFGVRMTELMAGRPGIYRGARAGDAVALSVLAALLIIAAPASAERLERHNAADPSALKGELAFQLKDRSGRLRSGGTIADLPGKDPAIGGPYVALRAGKNIRLLDRETLEILRTLNAGNRGANAVAVSRRWLVWRARKNGRDLIYARKVQSPQNVGRRFRVAKSGSRDLSAPGIHGNRLVFASAGKRENKIIKRTLRGGPGGPIQRSDAAALMFPSVRGKRVLFVKYTASRQQLVLKRLGGGTRVLWSRSQKRGYLLSTSLDKRRAYATVKRGSGRKIISVQR